MNMSDLPLPRDWAQMLRRYVGLGWSPALLTFMFAQMVGTRQTIQRRQASEVEEMYGRVLTRMVRHPTSPTSRGQLPIWLCAPDFPIYKRDKDPLGEVTINDGQHVHALALTPPQTRLKTDFVTFVMANQHLIIRHMRCLRVHAEAVIYDVPHVFGYVLKCDARARDDEDGFFVLPRSPSEVRDDQDRIGRNASLFGTTPDEDDDRIRGKV